jgi:hypothetical protein
VNRATNRTIRTGIRAVGGTHFFMGDSLFSSWLGSRELADRQKSRLTLLSGFWCSLITFCRALFPTKIRTLFTASEEAQSLPGTHNHRSKGVRHFADATSSAIARIFQSALAPLLVGGRLGGDGSIENGILLELRQTKQCVWIKNSPRFRTGEVKRKLSFHHTALIESAHTEPPAEQPM